MTRHDALVIGAGINGLVAAATLARRGKLVCLVEARNRLGGLATAGSAEGPGLAHLLYNLSPTALSAAGQSAETYFSGPALSTLALCPEGRHVLIDGGKACFADGTTHPDAPAFAGLHDRLTDYGALLRRLAEGPPPGTTLSGLARLRQIARLAGFGLGVRRMGKRQMRQFLKVLLSNAADLILDEMPDGPLAGSLAADAVRGIAAGPRSPGTVFTLVYRHGHGATAHPLPPDLFEALAASIREAGGEIVLETGVEHLHVEGDRITGATLTDGRRLGAATILSTLPPGATARLCGLDRYDIEMTRRLRTLRSRGTAAKVHLKLADVPGLPGVDRPLDQLRLVHAPSVAAVERAFNPVKYAEMSKAPVIEAVLVRGRDGAPWLSAIVQHAPADLAGGWSEDARAVLAERTVSALSPALPGLAEKVTAQEVITPDQMGSDGGHWHQVELALDQLLTLRPVVGLDGYRMGPRGLFLAGAAAHPGGDVMGLAGRNAAEAALGYLA